MEATKTYEITYKVISLNDSWFISEEGQNILGSFASRYQSCFTDSTCTSPDPSDCCIHHSNVK